MKNTPPKNSDKDNVKIQKKNIRETEHKNIKKSSINKIDLISEVQNSNLYSQKSFDKLYKDKFTNQKLTSKIKKR